MLPIATPLDPPPFKPQRFKPEEQARVDVWLRKHKLNSWGDPKNLMYLGGSPCFDERLGDIVCDPFSKIMSVYPERPWNGEHQIWTAP
ncbi:hypothetical protein T492DRAFT_1099530, partial [Pavlovales sp. CCMP2436]